MKNPFLWRTVKVDTSSFNEAERTIDAILSSEQPYLREAGYEVLEHTASAIDTRYLDAGAAFLEEHDLTLRRGGIVKYFIDEVSRALRITIKFSERPEAEYLMRDIAAGITPQLSVGYFIDPNSIEVTGIDAEGTATYTVRKWVPYEGSSVVVAADPVQAGVGRSVEDVVFQRNEANVAAVREAFASALDKHLKAVELGKATDVPTEETEAVVATENEAIAEQEHEAAAEPAAEATETQPEAVVEEVETSNETRSAPAVHAAKSNLQEDLMKFNLHQAVRNLHNVKADSYEFGVSKEIEAMVPAEHRKEGAIWVPQSAFQRTQSVNDSSGTAGGNIVLKDHYMYSEMIGPLRDAYVLDRLGIRMLNLQNTITIPKADGARAFVWGTAGAGNTRASREQALLEKQQYTTGYITLAPVRGGTYMEWTDQLALETAGDLTPMLQDDLLKCVSLEKQRVLLNGNGVNEPLGLAGRAIQSVDFANTIPTRDELIDMRKAVASANGVAGVWLMSAAMFHDLQKTPVGTAGRFLIENDGLLLGMPVVISNAVPDDEIYTAQWDSVLWADFGAVRIELSRDSNDALHGVNKYIVSLFADTNVRREAFVVKGKKA